MSKTREEILEEIGSHNTAIDNLIEELKIMEEEDDLLINLPDLFKQEGVSFPESNLIEIRCSGYYKNKAFYLNEEYTWEINRDDEQFLVLIPTH